MSRSTTRRRPNWQRRLAVESLEDRRLLSIDLVSTVAPTLIAPTANGASAVPSLSLDGRYLAFQSDGANLVAGDSNGYRDIFVTDMQVRSAVRASTDSAAAQANGASEQPWLSGNGRYVAFRSLATNLVPGDTNALADIFVKDLQTGATTRASTDVAGGQADGASFSPSLSSDGRYVAFSSSAGNLVPGDTNGQSDIFVKDLVSGAIVRASAAADGTQADAGSSAAVLSSDGRYVALASDAANLVVGDTNSHGDVFVKDLQSGAVVRASTDGAGAQGNGDALEPSLSGDGRLLAFMSYSNNLVAGDTNLGPDIFVKDLNTGATRRVSTDSAGVQAASSSELPSLSADGRYVAFRSFATNLVAGDSNSAIDVFVKDLQTGATIRASTDSAGKQSNGDSYQPVLSGNGLRLAFDSAAANLVSNDTNASRDILLKNLTSGTVQIASIAGVPQLGGNADSDSPATSADGRYVAFSSAATNLVASDTNNKFDVFRKDLRSGAVQRVSITAAGTQPTKDVTAPSISSDGRYVAFGSLANNLVAGDSNDQADVFVKDMLSGAIRLASTDGAGGQGVGPSFEPALSADGRYVTFQSEAPDLVAGDTNGQADIFVKDLLSGAVVRASVDGSGGESNGASTSPSLNADGRYVTFASVATNLVDGDLNGSADVFVKDLQTGAIVRASADGRGRQANDESSSPRLKADGRYVAFDSQASNLVAGDTNHLTDVFVKDLQTGALVRASTDSLGGQGDGWSSSPSLSADGRYVAFASGSTNLAAGDVNLQNDVFVKDLQSGTTTLLSTDRGGLPANGKSASPSISANGRYVVFSSTAGNLDPADMSTTQDVFRASVPATVAPNTVGLFDESASQFYLRNTNTSGAADFNFGYGAPDAGWQLLVGDWDGNGTTGVGLYAPESSTFYLTDSYTDGYAEHTFGYGEPQAGWIPLVGDWNGDGRPGVGLYDPQASVFYLTDTLQTGVAQYTFGYGEPGAGWKPIVGDWDGDGRSGVGLYDPQASVFYLRNALAGGFAERTFGFGQPGGGWQPLVGDWNGDWSDGVGLFDPNASVFYLTNSFTSGFADVAYAYAAPGSGSIPLVGDWNGDLRDGVGLYAPSLSTFYLSNTFQGGQVDYTVGFGQPSAGWLPLVGSWTNAVAQPGTVDAQAVDQLDLAGLASAQLSKTTSLEDFDLASTNPAANTREIDLALQGL